MNYTNWAYWIAGQAGVIPIALGMPGVAKTSQTAALAKASNRHFMALMLDQLLPEDLGGYPVVKTLEHDGQQIEVMRRVLDEKFIRARLEPSILLIDELTNVGHSVQAAALQLMVEGIQGCWIFAAANPPEQAAAGVELTPPMVNRLCVLAWEVDQESILSGWRNGLQFPPPTIPILPVNWMDCAATWGVLMAEFVTQFPDLLCAYPKDPAKASEPYPSPRSWTNVIKLLGACDSVDAPEAVKVNVTSGCVGSSASVQFRNWLATQDLPDPESILANPSSLRLPRRGDLAIAVMSSVMNRVACNTTPDRWEAAMDVLGVAFGQSQEVAIASHGRLFKLKPTKYLPKSRNGVFNQINAIINAAA